MKTKNIVLGLLLMIGSSLAAQDCKPHKQVQDEFLEKEINYYGEVIGINGSLLEQTITSILVNKEDSNNYTLTCVITCHERAVNLSINNGTSFDLKTEEGIKTYTSTSIKIKNRIGIETYKLSLSVSRKDIEYLRDNMLLKYQIASFQSESIQGTVDQSKASAFQNQMGCLLDDTYIKVNATSSTKVTPFLSDIMKKKESSSTRKHEINVMIGNSQLDYLGEGNIRVAIVGSYTKRISDMLSFGFHVGMTRSKLLEEDTYEDLYFNSTTGEYESITVIDNHTYKTDRIFLGPKLSFIAYETDKFQLFGSAGVSAALYRDIHNRVREWGDGDKTESHDVTKKIVFNYDLYGGVHYFLNQHFALSATVGLGISRFRVGFSYQF